ncbi:MAG: ATP-binding protein, partial [Lentisphaerae bacterium]|nr:ATP-binding protein [Lentisphaerota bacterium]
RMRLPVLQGEKPENVDMEADLPSPGPCISADAKQIKQILNNLVINAWESIGDGTGTIHLSVRTVSSADIPKSHRFPLKWQSREQLYACLEVKDSGCGIREEDMDKVFDPFFSTKFTGRGLGLSVVLGYVRINGAVITTENGTGGGSVFSVFFPLSAQMAPRQNEPVAKTPKIVQGGTVLLVEDEKVLREMIKFALIGSGFTVL